MGRAIKYTRTQKAIFMTFAEHVHQKALTIPKAQRMITHSWHFPSLKDRSPYAIEQQLRKALTRVRHNYQTISLPLDPAETHNEPEKTQTQVRPTEEVRQQ